MNRLSQCLHAYGLSPVCNRRCICQPMNCPKAALQYWQMNGFSPVWVIRCLRSPSARTKVFGQSAQRCGRSVSWTCKEITKLVYFDWIEQDATGRIALTNMCALCVALVRDTFAQISQMKLGPCCSFICAFMRAPVKKTRAQSGHSWISLFSVSVLCFRMCSANLR